MKLLLAILLLMLSLTAISQQTTTVKVPPSKDTMIITFVTVTTTTSNTATSYTTTTKPPIDTVPPPVDTTTPPGGYDGYHIAYSNGYDKASDINSNQLGRGSISATIFKSGTGSFKSVVNAGDGQISSGWRSEQQYPGSYTPDNKNIIIEYDERFETLSSVEGLSVQWHGGYTGTSGIMSMWIGGRKFTVQQNLTGASLGSNTKQTRQFDGSPLMTIDLNKWYHMKWELRFSTGSDGYLRCYIDGKLYYQVLGKTTDSKGQYLKTGQNLFSSPNSNSIIYVDNLVIYHAN